MSTLYYNEIGNAYDDYFELFFQDVDDGAVNVREITSTYAEIEYDIGLGESHIYQITGLNIDERNGDSEVNSIRLLIDRGESFSQNSNSLEEIYHQKNVSFDFSIDEFLNDYDTFKRYAEPRLDDFEQIFANAGGFYFLEGDTRYLSFENSPVYPEFSAEEYYYNLGFGSSGDDTILGSGNFEEFAGGSGNDLLIGQGGNDNLRGGDGNDVLRGGRGEDTIMGNNGNDTLIGAKGGDEVRGHRGDDLIRLGQDDDIARGSAGNDTLLGAKGEDTLRGGAGDDVIVGGAGDDFLGGGTGADRFIFRGEVGEDQIAGFQGAAGDVIDISAYGYDGIVDLTLDGGIGSEDGNAVITLAGGSITLLGVDADTLSADDFIF